MSTEEFKVLINKYFEGDASLDEERKLKQLFMQDNIPEEYTPYKAHFSYLAGDSGITMEKDPFARIEEEDSGLDVDIIPIVSKRKRILWISGIAASVIIMIGVAFQINKYINKVEDIYTDKDIAYHQAKNALLYVSSKLNNGTDKLEPIDRMNNGVNSLKQVTKFEDGLEQSQKFTRYNKLDKVIGTSN